MSKIMHQKVISNNPYSRRYEQLRQAILEAATDTWDELDVAAIELVHGYFEMFDEPDSGCPDVWSSYEALRYLHENGVLDEASEWFVTPQMCRHDVAFGLALYENEAANFLLSESVAAHGWEQADAQAIGLRAATSATECYMWGLALKTEWLANHPRKCVAAKCRGEDAPQYWVFRSSGISSQAVWHRPRIVWVTPEFCRQGRPMMRPLRPGSRQLRAVAATIAYRRLARSGQVLEIAKHASRMGVDAGDADSAFSPGARLH